MNWYLEALRKYSVFSARAGRKEYWYFVLFNFMVSGVLVLIALLTGFGVLGGIYGLAVIIPSIAVSVRRLHDTGRSGWWLLIGLIPLVNIVLLVFLVQDSDPGENPYGPNPKEILEAGRAQASELERPATPSAAVKTSSDPLEALRRLGELRNAEVISEDEFDRKKAELIDRV